MGENMCFLTPPNFSLFKDFDNDDFDIMDKNMGVGGGAPETFCNYRAKILLKKKTEKS